MEDEELKRQRRLEKNRVSAQKSRQRKKERAEALTVKLRTLEAENLELRLNLKVGRESMRVDYTKSQELIRKLKEMIGNAEENGDAGGSGGHARDAAIKQEIRSLQDKFSDYGRDRSSGFEFHLGQLQRSLDPTVTTRCMLWILSLAPQFLNDDGSDREVPLCEDEEIQGLWRSLMEPVQASEEQRKLLIILNDPASCPFPRLKASADETLSLIARLRELVSDKNSSLDTHIRCLSSTMTPTQVAKFIFWADKNPTLLQLVGKLLGPIFADRPAPDPGMDAEAIGDDESLQSTHSKDSRYSKADSSKDSEESS
jgi:hypothetical protein